MPRLLRTIHGKALVAVLVTAMCAVGGARFLLGDDAPPLRAQLSTAPLCDPRFCGNGEPDAGEQCDDGNSVDDDGCDALCRIECTQDLNCPSGECAAGVCVNLCGNGIVNGELCVDNPAGRFCSQAEQCDDGILNGQPGKCTHRCTFCGNGTVDTGEQCDEGANNGKTGSTCSIRCGPPQAERGDDVDGGESCVDNNACADDESCACADCSAAARCADLCIDGDITLVDTVPGPIGVSSSVAVPSDGRPVILYDSPVASGFMELLKCGNGVCSSGNVTTQISASVGKVAIGSDGLPLIAHNTLEGGSLHMLHCGNAACSAGNSSVVIDDGGAASLIVPPDGRPVLSYVSNLSGGQQNVLRVLKCGNTTCTSDNVITTVDSTPEAGYHNSIAVGADGFPVVSYAVAGSTAGSAQEFRVLKCGNAACSAGNVVRTLESATDPANNFGFTTVRVASDGKPIIAYAKYTDFKARLRVVKCGDASCSTGNVFTTIDTESGGAGDFASMTMPADGKPFISYHFARTISLPNNSFLGLKGFKCSNAACTTGITTVLDGGASTDGSSAAHGTSVVLAANGFPFIGYQNFGSPDTTDVNVIPCKNATCGKQCDASCDIATDPACNQACGDGVVDSGEQCDDGNTDDADACTNQCRTRVGVLCGNGVINPGEQCDDGNTIDGDACSNSCRLPACTGSQCPRCGDGIAGNVPGEQCDDGNTADNDACSNSCVGPCASDGQCAAFEQCQCSDCAGAVRCAVNCGDGIVDGGEGCDNGLLNRAEIPGRFEELYCKIGVCQLPACSDSRDNDFDGLSDARDGGCFRVLPGSTRFQYLPGKDSEECELGTTDLGAICVAGCVPGSLCPDRQICPASGVCPGPVCGNGEIDPGEECDDRNTIDGDGCNDVCELPPCTGPLCPRCGDGIAGNVPGEQCDDGNLSEADSCGVLCRTIAPVCGDGIVNPVNEQCDDGNRDGADRCTNSCVARCGQNVECPGGLLCFGQECGKCTSSFQCPAGFCVEGACVPGLPICGNGVTDPGEACDNGDPASCTDRCLLAPGRPCTLSMQCGSFRCEDSVCRACESDDQCPSDFLCSGGNCRARTPRRTIGEQCEQTSQCESTICSAGTCAPCRDTDECAEGTRCAIGLCLTDAEMALRPNICGNGTVDSGEACDDGNAAFGDGCTPACDIGDEPMRSEVAADVTVQLPFGSRPGDGAGLAPVPDSGGVDGRVHPAGDKLSDTGPATVAVMAAGAAAGTAWVRKRFRRKKS